MTKLRPIGEEFDYGFPPMESASRSVFSVYRYKVIAYAECATRVSWGADGKPQPQPPFYTAETVDVIGGKEYEPIEYRVRGRHLIPIPPPEIAHLFPTYN